MKIKVKCKCGKVEIIDRDELNDWECKACMKETSFVVNKIPKSFPLVRYKVYAHSSKESAWDAFEEAMEKSGIEAVWEDNREASFVGCEIELNVAYDVITKKFYIESIKYDDERYYKSIIE